MAATQGRRRRGRDVTGILLLDKPAGVTANAALQRVKRLYGAAKAGHAGSLDPIATGLLPVCLGQATKLCGVLLGSDKRYRVRARLGQRTTTGDTEGEVIGTSDPAGLRREELERALVRFSGEIRQRPPMYSALKQGGRRLYELAREGREVERAERPVTVQELRLTAFDRDGFELELRCSKGTYVRTLVEDLAASVGQCAHVAALRRLEVDPFGDRPLVSMEALEQAALRGTGALDALLLPAVEGLGRWPRLQADPATAFYLSRGQGVRIAGAPRSGPVAILDGQGGLLGLGEIDLEGRVQPRRWLS